ncbi:MAG: phage head-tail connector protein [Fimbriiglobus sp.]
MSLIAIKSQLGLTIDDHDAQLTQLEAAALAFAEDYCGRQFSGATHTAEFPAGECVFLDRYPVEAITEVVMKGVVVPEADYRLHADVGILESLAGVWRERIRVTWTTPSLLPTTVERAITELVSHWFREATTHAHTNQLNQLSTADGITYPWSQSTGYRTPPAVLEMLNLHKQVRV